MKIRTQLKSDLKDAMKRRDQTAVQTLRSLLAEIDNAEAVELSQPVEPSIGKTNDVARKVLTAVDIRAILQHEIEERQTAIAEYEQYGQHAAAEQLRAEVALIEQYL